MPFILALALGSLAPERRATPRIVPEAVVAPSTADSLYQAVGLAGKLDRAAFDAGLRAVQLHGLKHGVLAIADLRQPSTKKRLYVIDLGARKLLLNTYVAHGQGSGELVPNVFSNRVDSHQTSLGLYRVGEPITSPKHGPALLLHGLDKGINDKALARELIIHGADYVSEQFIAKTGRLGRSWGCPAVPEADMAQVIQFLADGGLLYVHAG